MTIQEWIQVGASVALVFVTFVLAWATIQYANQSRSQTEEIRKSREEMEKTREAEYLPFLKAATNLRNAGWTHFLIANIGKGTAHNVEVEFRIEGIDDSERSWGQPLFHPGEDVGFSFPIGPDFGITPVIDKLESEFEMDGVLLFVRMEYEDALGNQHERIQHIDVIKELRARTDAGEFDTEPVDT